MTATSIRALLQSAKTRLQPTSETPALDAEVLLTQVLEKPRSYLFAWPEKNLSAMQVQIFQELLERRCQGEPIAYISGRREFWSLELEVNGDTLIPRPETELLVELALERIPSIKPARVADLGTGSGAIALAIASERPQTQIMATDISAAALAIAHRNSQRHNITNVEFCQGDWGLALAGQSFDVIVSNPPYIAADSCYLHQGDVRFEPYQALVAEKQGLSALDTIIAQAVTLLKPQGWLLLEHGYDQGETINTLLRHKGYTEVNNFLDMNGLSRVSMGKKL